MVVVPAGEFMMGSNDGGDDEKPLHEVTISTRSRSGVLR
jgi:formylglycine-generating enzyme required for sulfatase activity